MKLPNKLLQKIQADYVDSKYREGLFTFNSLPEETIVIVIESFIDWAKEAKLTDNDLLDLSLIKEW